MPAETTPARCPWILFSSRGHIGLIRPDGTGERYLRPDVPDQVSWGAGDLFPDGRRLILNSYEQGKVWEHHVRSHVWAYDLLSGDIEELCTQDRPAEQMPAALLLPGEQRIVTGPLINGEQVIVTMNLDGSDQVWVTQPGQGFHYCVALSPDGARLACHATMPDPYRIVTMDLDGGNRTTVALHPDHLYFGPAWSPDGEWLVYQDCLFQEDPGHDWANICLGRPDGSEHRVVTEGYRQWFGTSYGSPENRGGGSNMPAWSPDGAWVAYTRKLPGSRTAWEFQPQRPDTDHYNRDYKPEKARGGTEIVLMNPFTGEQRQLTHNDPPLWDFRASFSPDGQQIVFSRVAVGGACEIWVMDADGGNQRPLTRGIAGLGADFGRWVLIRERIL